MLLPVATFAEIKIEFIVDNQVFHKEEIDWLIKVETEVVDQINK
jgi:hypothetical protein